MKLTLTLLFALQGAVSVAHAVYINSPGSCGVWGQPQYSINNHAWVSGYLSGMAVAHDSNVLEGIDPEAINGWMDNYCRAHPLERMATAADKLFAELTARRLK